MSAVAGNLRDYGHVSGNCKLPICGNRKPHTFLVGGWRSASHDVGRSNSEGAHKLTPYREIIATLLEEFPELSAKRLFDEIRAAGYSGGYSRVRDYVRAVRPRSPVEAVVRFETPAGQQGQVDFGTFTLPWGWTNSLLRNSILSPCLDNSFSVAKFSPSRHETEVLDVQPLVANNPIWATIIGSTNCG